MCFNQIQKIKNYYSLTNIRRLSNSNLRPVMTYNNLLEDKHAILNTNKGKSGIYRLVNKVTNETYIGSTINITQRLKNYYSVKFLETKLLKDKSKINRALLEYGYSNFKLDILEYCDKKVVLKKEQYFFDLLKPEYNILKVAGSFSGFKHSPETLLKFQIRNLKIGHAIIVVDQKDGTEKEYNSIREAARNLKVSHPTLLSYIDINKRLSGRYLITRKINLVKPILVKPKIKLLKTADNTEIEFTSLNNLAKYLSEIENLIVYTSTLSKYKKYSKLYMNKYRIFDLNN